MYLNISLYLVLIIIDDCKCNDDLMEYFPYIISCFQALCSSTAVICLQDISGVRYHDYSAALMVIYIYAKITDTASPKHKKATNKTKNDII